MISTKGIKIWTPYGYSFADDLYIGEKVISFNPDRGVCEYDTIQSIEVEYRSCAGYGLQAKSMRQVLTADHPVLIWDSVKKKLSRHKVEDKFMMYLSTGKNRYFLSSAPFEPYRFQKDLEDVKWSARVAATLANHRNAKVNLGDSAKDLCGYEAQVWLDTFFHWNRMVPANNWMATVKLTNIEVRDIIFDIAPRAGVGAKFHRLRNSWVISITADGAVNTVRDYGWFKERIDGLVFNVTTRNGSVLAKNTNGTFLLGCNRQEDK